jgi:hypothetical protein
MTGEVEMGDVDGETGVDVEMKNATSPASKDVPEMSFEVRLLEQVKCRSTPNESFCSQSQDICTEVLYNPVILHFCGHVFCGYSFPPLGQGANRAGAVPSHGWPCTCFTCRIPNGVGMPLVPSAELK